MSFVQRDYIMRVIEEMCGVILYLVGLRRDGESPQVVAAIERETERILGIDVGVLRGMGPEEAIEAARRARLTRPGVTEAEWWISFAVFWEESAALHQDDDPDAAGQAEQISTLALDHIPTDESSSETLARMVAAYDASEPLPASFKTVLWLVHERFGAYGHAEDWLFDLLESDPSNARLLQRASTFYQRLEALPDDELTSGGLPRAEVLEGRAHVRSLVSST